MSLITVALAAFNDPTADCIPASAHVISGLTIAGKLVKLPAVITPVIMFIRELSLVVSVEVTMPPAVIVCCANVDMYWNAATD